MDRRADRTGRTDTGNRRPLAMSGALERHRTTTNIPDDGLFVLK